MSKRVPGALLLGVGRFGIGLFLVASEKELSEKKFIFFTVAGDFGGSIPSLRFFRSNFELPLKRYKKG